jgi:hypothetical protein
MCSKSKEPHPKVWISSKCTHLTFFDLTRFVENVSNLRFFNASAIMQRLMPNNFRTSYTRAYPSLKSSFPVPILLSVCNAIQGLCTEDSTVMGTRMQLLKVQGRYVDVSVLLQNGFTPNLHHCYTEFSTDGIKTWALNLVSLEEKP